MKYFFALLSLLSSLWAAPKAIILNDTTNHYHWGCTGTSTAVKESIEAIGYKVETVDIYTMRGAKNVPSTFALFGDLRQFELFKASNPELLEHLSESDAIVINGEGSIHLDNPLPRALLYVAYISKEFLDKHVEIINHSCFPEDTLIVNDPSIEELYTEVYQRLDYVSVREPLSQKVMRLMGSETDISFDSLPLYIQKHYNPPEKSSEKIVLLAGSVSWEAAGLEAIKSEAKKLENEGYKIKVLVGAKDYPAYDDSKFIDYLEPELKEGWELVNATSMDEWLNAIAEADLLISGRFHHTIAAICLERPFVALNSNTPKIEGMLMVMPKPGEVLSYEDPRLSEKLGKAIDVALGMQDKDFPSFEAICENASRKFFGLQELYPRLISSEMGRVDARGSSF